MFMGLLGQEGGGQSGLDGGASGTALQKESALLARVVEALDHAASDGPGGHEELRLSLRQGLRLQRALWATQASTDSASTKKLTAVQTQLQQQNRYLQLVKTLEGMLMIKFMPRLTADKFYQAMESAGLTTGGATGGGPLASTPKSTTPPVAVTVAVQDSGRTLAIGVPFSHTMHEPKP